MKVQKTTLKNVLLFSPYIFEDNRGFYVEIYNKKEYSKIIEEQIGENVEFLTDCISVSYKNVLRGIHGDAKTWKLISCLEGEIYLVVVNCDKESEDFGKWESFFLSEKNRNQVLVPAKYGNAHLVISDRAIFHYKQSSYYDPENLKQFTYRYDNPLFNISYPIKNPILSKRDNRGSVLIVGASGFIGKRLYDFLGNNFEVYGTGYRSEEFDKVDVTDKKVLEEYILSKKPETIIWLSGERPEFCERNPAEGLRINSEALFSLVEILKKSELNSKLIYVSSDRIFDGKSAPYIETDVPSPTTNYGFTKKICEKFLESSDVDYKIIRTSAVIGKGGVFSEWILEKLRSGEKTEMFSNNYFTPTPRELFCENVEEIIKNWETINQKIIHLSGGERMSRFDFVINFAKHLNISNYDVYKKEGNSSFPEDSSLKPSRIIKFKKSFWDYIVEEFNK